MRRSPTRIRWYQPAPPAQPDPSPELLNRPHVLSELERAPAAFDIARVAADRNFLRNILTRVGIPVAEGAQTATEFAIELLKLAAEIEHALMVQYLYAMTSVPNALGPDGVNYRTKLKNIAIQEMGHLATVQNLLLVLGGRDAFYMQRDPMREASDKNPMPFVLEPVSKVSLAKAVAVEMPARVRPELEAKVNELVALAEKDAGVDTHRVGVIYEFLKWIFRPPEEANEGIDFGLLAGLPEHLHNLHITDEDLRDLSEVTQYEALPEEWGDDLEDILIEPVHNCADAHNVVGTIAEQGEGLEDKDASHFGEFMEMVKAFEAGSVTVIPIAKSPTLGAHGSQGGEVISHPYTQLWGEVFSLQYSLLVLTIYHALVTPRPSDGSIGLRGDLADLAVDGMRMFIGRLSDLMAELPLRNDGSSAMAGPPYDLDPAILESNEDDDLVAQHLRMLDRLTTVYSAIEGSPDFPTHPNHPNRLANLRNYDTRRRNLFPPPAPPTA
jgi:rubrerythrin